MQEYSISTYGDKIADVYDDLYAELQDLKPIVDTLATLAKGRRVLELGIGTGRIALPLAKRGLKVTGIDSSKKMVAKMVLKANGLKIPVRIGNFADVPVQGKYSLIFVVFNTFFNLLTQKEQVRCLRNVSKRLTSGGSFLIEAFVPNPALFVRNQNMAVTQVRPDLVRLDVATHDGSTQRVSTQHIHISDGSTRLYPVELRYVWPSEMDLMAEIAGLRLMNRWSDWNKSSFNSTSSKHISIYQKR